MPRKWPIFLLSLAIDDSFTVKRCGSQLRTSNCHSPLLNLHGPLYQLFKSQIHVLLAATKVTTITAPLLMQTGWNTTDIQEKSGPLPYYLFPFKLVSIVLDTHISGCATSIHLWVSVWHLKNRKKNSIMSFSKSPQFHTSSMFEECKISVASSSTEGLST